MFLYVLDAFNKILMVKKIIKISHFCLICSAAVYCLKLLIYIMDIGHIDVHKYLFMEQTCFLKRLYVQTLSCQNRSR